MNIAITDFNFNYHGMQTVGNFTHGKYIFHNIDVFNQIIIDNVAYDAVYQCGMSYLYNDYDCPRPELELSEPGGTHNLLVLVNNLYESDFNNDDIELEKFTELCPAIDRLDKLRKLYDVLMNNKPCLHDFLNDLINRGFCV